MAEYLDIVNEQDEVIGRNTYTFVHQNKLLHRFTRTLVFNDKNELILHTRCWGNKQQFRKLDCAGGHVSSGENYEQGALRELQEEMGISADLTEIGKIEYHGDEFMWDGMFGRAFIAFHNGPYFGDDEVIDYKPLLLEDVFTILQKEPEKLTPQLQNTLIVYQQYLKNKEKKNV